LLSGQSVEAICTEMKDRCYQRGAEDNLTAVIVQLGTPPAAVIDEERTVSNERYEPATTAPAIPVAPEARLTPPSRIAFPGPNTPQQVQSTARNDPKAQSGGGRAVLRF